MDNLNPVTAVILAGGKSSRMGRDKLALPLGDETLLQRAVRRFSAVFPRVLVSVSGMDRYGDCTAPRVADIHPGLGPISGLHAALTSCEGGVFLTAADMPFASPEAARELVLLARGYDACVIRRANGRLEPLFAYYGAAALGECERIIESGRYNIARVFECLGTRYIAPSDIGEQHCEEMLLNVNNPDDYEKIQKLGQRA